MTAVRNLALFGALLAMAADPEPPPPAPPKADIRGAVKAMSKTRPGTTTSFLATLMVEGKKEADTKHAKGVVRLATGGKIWIWRGGKKVEGAIGDITPGTLVQCVFDGPVTEGPRMIGTTKEILILPAPKK